TQAGWNLNEITSQEVDWKSASALFAKFFKDDPWSDFTRKDSYVSHYYLPDALEQAEIRNNALRYAKKMINFGQESKSVKKSKDL
ncbi:MAG: hypothetical protein RRY34_04720, partial [Victivallaceae bacterium]